MKRLRRHVGCLNYFAKFAFPMHPHDRGKRARLKAPAHTLPFARTRSRLLSNGSFVALPSDA